MFGNCYGHMHYTMIILTTLTKLFNYIHEFIQQLWSTVVLGNADNWFTGFLILGNGARAGSIEVLDPDENNVRYP